MMKMMILPFLVPTLLAPALAHRMGRSPSNESTAAPACINVTELSAGCFDALTVSFYLTEIWNNTVRLETCSPSQLWSTCFFNRALSLTSPGTTFTAANISQNDCSTLTIAPSNITYLGPGLVAGIDNITNGTCPSLEGFLGLNLQSGEITRIAALAAEGRLNIKIYYVLYVIINVHAYLSAWASALLSPIVAPTLGLITSIRKSQSPGQVLDAVISTYGLDRMADSALQKLLLRPSISPVPGAVAAASTGLGAAATTGAQGEVTAEMMVQKLAETLRLVMQDLDAFLLLVGTGAFANTKLPGFESLVQALS